MRRKLTLLGLAALGMIATAVPAAAFWERSQWRRCSEGTTAAEYQRWRCWELDGYGGAIAPSGGQSFSGRSLRQPRGKPPGGIVERLG